MIQPGDIYRTKGYGLLIAVEVKRREQCYTVWSMRRLDKSMREILAEDYWLNSQEKLT